MQRDLLEDFARLAVHRLVRKLGHDLEDDALHVGALDAPVVDPLPDLRTRDLRGRSVLHEVVDRRRADALQPGGDVPDADGDIGAHSGLGDVAGRRGHVEQIGGGRRHILT